MCSCSPGSNPPQCSVRRAIGSPAMGRTMRRMGGHGFSQPPGDPVSVRVNYTGYIWLYIAHAKSQYKRVLVEYQRGSTWIGNIFKLQTFLGYKRPRGESSMLSIISSGARDERINPPTPHLLAPALNKQIFGAEGLVIFAGLEYLIHLV